MIVVFDTETTGLPKNWKAPVSEVNNWPRVIQLGWQTWSDATCTDLINVNNFIIKPDGFTIPKAASDVHGITDEIAKEKGVPIADVIDMFLKDINRATHIVAHNISFDSPVLGAEMIRLGVSAETRPKRICTKEASTNYCKIPGQYGYKWPKLEELHRFLFAEDFDGAHDALSDVQATSRCFAELVKRSVIQL